MVDTLVVTGDMVDRPQPPDVAQTSVTAVTAATSTRSHMVDVMSASIRPAVAAVLTLGVVYLAIRGVEAAVMTIVTSFALLVGSYWGERGALKKPGTDL